MSFLLRRFLSPVMSSSPPWIRLKNPALPSGSVVLVTGANGLTGSHIANQLLLAGYYVRGTVRDPAKNKWLLDYFDGKYGKGRFQMVQVQDVGTDGAFERVLKGV